MTVTIRRSLILVVALFVVTAGVFVVQRASAASATPVVYVATGENFPDALGAASAAAVNGGPVLLVTKDSIPAETKAELSRLSPDVIYVAGGTAVVSDAVFDELKAYAGSVVRVAGANRYSTAVEVSKSAFPATGGGTAALEARIAELEALLAGVSRNSDTLLLSGMNLQVVNGTSATNGTPNGVGNVIIGYNELPPSTPAGYRSGSHNLVVGALHSYTDDSYGGIVAGHWSTIDGAYASVTGGFGNEATGDYASVTGGTANTASGLHASVVGGSRNIADGGESSICGGEWNEAVGDKSTISGGKYNDALGQWSSVSGGQYNVAEPMGSSILGGSSNTLHFNYDHYPK